MRFALVLTCLLAAAPAAAASELDSAFARDVAIVVASEHACYRFDVYLATNDSQRARGLMYVRELPAMTGMLFIYDSDGYLSMWMKNTYIPLDILFIRGDGTVSSIARDTEPLSLRSLVSTEPVRYVLELNAGVTKSLSIDENSRLIWVPATAR